MPDRSVPRKTPTSITPNTVVVLCAIAALIAILVFLESRHPWFIGSCRIASLECSTIREFRDRYSTISSSERRSNTNTIRHCSFHQP
jgi:hypothetical protein